MDTCTSLRYPNCYLVRAARVVLIVLAGIGLLVATGEIGRPLVWEIPHGFHGWTTMRFGDPKCPPVSNRGIYIVLRLTSDSSGCTSSSEPPGWRYYRYEYVDSDGTRTVLRSSSSDHDAGVWPYVSGVFFVGTKAERDRSWQSAPRL
jgi:hypothetical protein